jgi:hypothetical protein
VVRRRRRMNGCESGSKRPGMRDVSCNCRIMRSRCKD